MDQLRRSKVSRAPTAVWGLATLSEILLLKILISGLWLAPKAPSLPGMAFGQTPMAVITHPAQGDLTFLKKEFFGSSSPVNKC